MTATDDLRDLPAVPSLQDLVDELDAGGGRPCPASFAGADGRRHDLVLRIEGAGPDALVVIDSRARPD